MAGFQVFTEDVNNCGFSAGHPLVLLLVKAVIEEVWNERILLGPHSLTRNDGSERILGHANCPVRQTSPSRGFTSGRPSKESNPQKCISGGALCSRFILHAARNALLWKRPNSK